MASAVEICNKALSLLGGKSIESLEEQSKEARACRLHWPILRNSKLRDHTWNCATKRVVLTRLTEIPAYGFKYYFQLPSDCLMVLEVEPGGFFEVEGRKLLSDSEELKAKIIWANDDTSRYDSQLTDAFSYLLAAELAYSITGSNSLAEGYRNAGGDLLSVAKASDALEGRTQDKKNQNWLRARYGR